MRIVSALLFILLVLFAVVQYNDPDGLLWAVIYGIPALFCALRAFKPDLVKSLWGYRTLSGAVILYVFGIFWYWPQAPGFWRQEVFWVTEEAREGMGMMIAFAALLIVWLGTRNQRQLI